MTSDERLHHLSFLLTFSSMAVACAVGDEPATTSLPPMVNPTNGNGNDTSDTGDDDDDTASPPDDSDGPGVTTDGADAPGTSDDAAPGTTTEPYGYTTTGDIPLLCDGMAPPMVGMIRPTCIQYVGHYNDCFYDGMQAPECVYFHEAYCEQGIQNNTAMYGMACGAALEDFLACLSQVPCPLLTDMQPDCEFESDEFDDLCM